MGTCYASVEPEVRGKLAVNFERDFEKKVSIRSPANYASFNFLWHE